MLINDLENELIVKGVEGLDLYFNKTFLLMYADDIVLFSETEDGLQSGLNILHDYCQKWKLTVSTQKTTIVIFRKGGTINRQTRFLYGGLEIDTVNKFTDLGIVFTVGVLFLKHILLLQGKH